jgi:hypothetical protein
MHALNRSHRGHVVSTVLRVFVMFIALSTSLTLEACMALQCSLSYWAGTSRNSAHPHIRN